ncbi:MAG: transcriptional repressor LexA [Desulfomonile tiedjei]|uniref:LexA repressor n=1 Tax=Desulfomonile tiedjei TaxID=2358 RepID=A0A9D6V582_9BACT|nr:transcriptional repressor LexA [Desulfomonile tiedjei]
MSENKSHLVSREWILEEFCAWRRFFLAKRAYALYNKNMEITEKQKEILRFIETFHSKEGGPPSLREICRGLGLASSGSLLKPLRALEAKGYLVRNPGKNRRWQLANRQSYAAVPLVGEIAAGFPILAQQNVEEYLPVDPSLFGTHEVFALRVRGDSMKDECIRDGDLAILKPQEDAESGEIVAVLVQGVESEATLKTLRRKNGDIELHPANPSYQVLRFSGPERAQVKILGKLVGIIRRPGA